LTDNSLQSADKDQQEMRAVAEKPHDAVVKFDTYRNVQRHRAVPPAIARLLFYSVRMSYNLPVPRWRRSCAFIRDVGHGLLS